MDLGLSGANLHKLSQLDHPALLKASARINKAWLFSKICVFVFIRKEFNELILSALLFLLAPLPCGPRFVRF